MPASTFGTVVGPNKICSPSPRIQKSNSLYMVEEAEAKIEQWYREKTGERSSGTAATHV